MGNPQQLEAKDRKLAKVSKQRHETKARLAIQFLNSLPKCTHFACRRIGHTNAQCWIKNPQLILNHLYHKWHMKVDQFQGAIVLEHRWKNFKTPWHCLLQHQLN